jgi:hypothetical protein
MSKRASYREGVNWIAFEDEPGDRDVEAIAGYISTCLLADLFGKDRNDVARDILRAREKDAAIT